MSLTPAPGAAGHREESDVRVQSPAATNKLGRVIKTVLVFAALGPLIGSLTIFIAGFFLTLPGFLAGIGAGLSMLRSAFFIIFFSYLLGLFPALLAGLAVGLGQAFFRSFGIAHALGIGVAVGIVMAWKPSLMTLLWDAIFWRNPMNPNSVAATHNLAVLLRGAAAYIVLCSVPTVLCWLVVRRRNRQMV